MSEINTNSDRPNVPDITIPQGITPFFFAAARGRIARLCPLTDNLIKRHQYPTAISILGGEALTLVALLASALKFEGSFSLQIKGDGAISLLVADCTHNGALRFYIRYNEEALQKLPTHASAKTLFGDGIFALTVDQGDNQDRYQGMVEIAGETLADMATHYFTSSEQLPCWIYLTTQYTPSGWRAAGMILEKIAMASNDPIPTEIAQESWNTLTTLATTITAQEILDETLGEKTLIHRLFHEENPVIGEAKPLSYGCHCSRSRLMNVLKNFNADDIESMVEDGKITMKCEFCCYEFVFNKEEISL